MWVRPASRLAVRSAMSCAGVMPLSRRAAGRTAQTAATQGRPVCWRQSAARSSQRSELGRSRVELARDFGFDLGAVLAGEERGVADEECGVGGGEHGDGVGALLGEGGARVVEVLEEDVRVGGGAARGGVGGDGGDVRESFGDGEIRGIFDEEKNAADLAERGDGAAGDDGELGRELGDGDEAEVGGAGVELARAVRGRGVVELVARAQSGGGGFVLEVEEEGAGFRKEMAADAKGHKDDFSGIRVWIGMR